MKLISWQVKSCFPSEFPTHIKSNKPDQHKKYLNGIHNVDPNEPHPRAVDTLTFKEKVLLVEFVMDGLKCVVSLEGILLDKDELRGTVSFPRNASAKVILVNVFHNLSHRRTE